MKKLAVFWWIFWLLYSFEVTGPMLVEAGGWRKSESRSTYTYCTNGNCTTTTTVQKNKHRDNYSNNQYGYSGGGYYYAPAPSGGGNNINIDIDLTPVVKGVGCVLTLGLVCELSGNSQSTQSPSQP
ncbi:hypothetical protein A2926_04410 [Candidatus Giovannonibacteria bacterium RIFCSPLOWO2_01_FULL_44_40]|uniref:Uncharacterized protein n=1 Tax=Candidatus Giovannonibacteria bacterium RIFCSPHIGHO2_01_FULL_45_23 TaxID=1798325 RepID=A0A1F5VHD0_9BACT|nr:MAG: hypothetical protein A2834_04660 [Candidatus Giovannonibacteria bacterium RIFCSPHIGHO2_01_FULL_45_23]OGF79560.1 MAG: hypothetical protein A2926_04410 [Candidatus Giovannonibacteria bacterium RIFCSPLOWO2_01_FULL_44_40]